MVPHTTRLSKALAVLLLLGFALQHFVPDTRSYLALVPGRTLPCVWNLLSSGFLIVNPAELVVDIVALLVLARLVEPIHGSKEFLRFIFLSALLAACTVFVAVFVMYAAAPSTYGTLLYTPFTGFHGVIAALLVAVKQIMPHTEMRLLGGLTVKFLPTLVLILVCGGAYGLDRLDLLAFWVPGTYLGWVYLRFFQLQPDSGGLHGDASDDFKFSSFFPDFMATPIDWVAGVLGVITRLRHAHGAEGRAHHLAGMPSALGSDSADASRRRERGARALEERLGKTQAGLGAPGAGDVELGGKGLSMVADAAVAAK